MVLKEFLCIDVLAVSAVAFSVSVIANYTLSILFVFKGGKNSKSKEFFIFVAHEMGHGVHVALALKRGNIPYGEPLTAVRLEIFDKVYGEISQEIYEVCFGNESFLEIQDICTRELGNCTFGNSHELIAQSFGNYYYGSKKSKVAKKIVNYFKKGLK